MSGHLTTFGERLAHKLRFRSVDAAVIESGDHRMLEQGDRCFYMHEFTKGAGFAGENQLITNLKKKPSSSNAAELNYKQKAIQQCAREFREALPKAFMERTTFVPVPPSKIPGHADHDDRMTRVCMGMGNGLDIRELALQRVSMESTHERSDKQRITFDELLDVYSINEALASPPPTQIAVVDDVLTAGTHFKAVQHRLSQRFLGIPVLGLFVSRRVFPHADANEA